MQPALKKAANAFGSSAIVLAPGHVRSAANFEANTKTCWPACSSSPNRAAFHQSDLGPDAPPLLAIPESLSELERCRVPSDPRLRWQPGFRCRIGRARVSPRHHYVGLLAQGVMVVNLAVEHELITPTGTGHGLFAGERSTSPDADEQAPKPASGSTQTPASSVRDAAKRLPSRNGLMQIWSMSRTP